MEKPTGGDLLMVESRCAFICRSAVVSVVVNNALLAGVGSVVPVHGHLFSVDDVFTGICMMRSYEDEVRAGRDCVDSL